MLVTAFTWPSSHRIGARVSRSHISAEPLLRAAAMNLPVGSNLAKRAPAKREVWIAVGWERVNGSDSPVISFSARSLQSNGQSNGDATD